MRFLMSKTLIPTWQSTIIFYRGEGAICGDKDDMQKETRAFPTACPHS